MTITICCMNQKGFVTGIRAQVLHLSYFVFIVGSLFTKKAAVQWKRRIVIISYLLHCMYYELILVEIWLILVMKWSKISPMMCQKTFFLLQVSLDWTIRVSVPNTHLVWAELAGRSDIDSNGIAHRKELPGAVLLAPHIHVAKIIQTAILYICTYFMFFRNTFFTTWSTNFVDINLADL